MHTSLSASTLRNKGQTQTSLDRNDWMERLLQAQMMRSADKVVGIAIALGVDPETGRCCRSSEALADECGMDQRYVRRVIPRLVDAGWIGIDRSGGRVSNRFSLTTPAPPSNKGGRANV